MSGYEIVKWSTLTERPGTSVAVPLFHPEYGRFMLESTPGVPFSNKVSDLLTVEDNMRYRLVTFRNRLLETTKEFIQALASSKAPQTKRDPVNPHILSSTRGSRAIHRAILRPYGRCL